MMISASSKTCPGFVVRKELFDQDEVIVRDVIIDDCYRVSDLPSPIANFIDVGSHIGTFARRIHQRFPRARGVGVDPIRDNNILSRVNGYHSYNNVLTGAVYYGASQVAVNSTVFLGSGNSGGTYVGESPTPPSDPRYREAGAVNTFTIEEIMTDMGWSVLDLLKLDCEGSEINILQNCTVLDKIGVIVGEWHDRGKFMEVWGTLFEKTGKWNLDILREGDIGLFRLSQKKWRNMP